MWWYNSAGKLWNAVPKLFKRLGFPQRKPDSFLGDTLALHIPSVNYGHAITAAQSAYECAMFRPRRPFGPGAIGVSLRHNQNMLTLRTRLSSGTGGGGVLAEGRQGPREGTDALL